MFSDKHKMKTNSRFDQGLRRLLCLVAAGLMTFGLIAGPAQAVAEVAKLTASDAAQADEFGSSVSVSGDVAVVGARLDDDAGYSSGAAYVYRFDGNDWLEEAKLTASDAAANDEFGSTVSVNGDVVVVGAIGNDDAGSNSGSAYVFVKPPAGWGDMTQTAKLTASDAAAADLLGRSVSVSADVVVVGAPVESSGRGAAYVFVKPPAGWGDMTQTAKLTASDGQGGIPSGDRFGTSVSVSGDVVVVGASGQEDGVGPYEAGDFGAAYVFVKPTAGWGDMTQTAKLIHSYRSAGHRLGWSVSVSGDVVVAGAPGVFAGFADVFVKPTAGWGDMTQTAMLTASERAAYDSLGSTVSVSGDVVVVGAPYDDDACPEDPLNCNSGSAYVFVKPPGGWVRMTETRKLTASDAATNDWLGSSVSVSGDVAVVGAPGDDDAGSASGAAYVFGLDNQAPVITCTGPVTLWSPDHDLVDVSSVISVTDPDGDPVTLTFRVFSDETEIPSTGDGTGQHAPDFKDESFPGGRGLLVRNERRSFFGEGGRVYIFVITADDGYGIVTTAVCAAAVVPHDQNQPSLDKVLAKAAWATAVLQFAVDSNTLPPTPSAPPGLREHGLSDPIGPKQ